MSNTKELETQDGLTLKQYDSFNYFSLEVLREEVANIFEEEYELSDEELLGVVEYIVENRCWFIQDAGRSVFDSKK